MEIKGKVVFINKATKPNAEKDFTVRDFCIDTSVEVNGTMYPSFASFQTVNAKCQILDDFNIGDDVEVSYSLSGMQPKKKEGLVGTEKNPNSLVCYTNLNCYGIRKQEEKEEVKDLF